jgi:hypothetical protein
MNYEDMALVSLHGMVVRWQRLDADMNYELSLWHVFRDATHETRANDGGGMVIDVIRKCNLIICELRRGRACARRMPWCGPRGSDFGCGTQEFWDWTQERRDIIRKLYQNRNESTVGFTVGNFMIFEIIERISGIVRLNDGKRKKWALKSQQNAKSQKKANIMRRIFCKSH